MAFSSKRFLVHLVLGLLICKSSFVIADSDCIKKVYVSEAEVRALSKIEISAVIDAEFDNPDNPEEIEIWAEFLSPAGKRFTVPAFYYQDYQIDENAKRIIKSGAPKWVVRYTPLIEGKFSVRICFKKNDIIKSSEQLYFTSLKPLPQSRGFVRINPGYKKYFYFENSREMFYPIGINLDISCRIGYKLGNSENAPEFMYDIYNRYKDLITKFHKSGGNCVRLRLDSWWLPLEMDSNWLGSNGFKLGRYNSGNAWIADKVVEICKNLGICIQLCTWNANTYNHWRWMSGGGSGTDARFHIYARFKQNEKLVKRRLRYQVARWSYSPELIAWEYFNEIGYRYNLAKDFDIHDVYWTAITNWLRQIDLNRHLIFNSREGMDARDVHLYVKKANSNLLDYLKRNEMKLPWSKYDPDKSRPYILGEYGRLIRNKAERLKAGPLHNDAREALWAGIVSHKSGCLYWWAKEMAEDFDKVFRSLAAYVKGEDFSKYSWKPAQFDLVSGPGGQRYFGMIGNREKALLYIVRSASGEKDDLPAMDGNKVELSQLKDGDYRIEWWNTMNPAKTIHKNAKCVDSKLILEIPDGVTRDLAAKVVRIVN